MARFGPFELDLGRRQLFRDGHVIHVTPKAFDLLKLLVEAAPRVLGKAELHKRLWPRSIVTDATLVSLIKELRRALADDESPTLIRTAHRVGYALDAVVECEPPTRLTAGLTRSVLTGHRRITLAQGEYVIGRDLEAHIRLDFLTVSRRHARLIVTANTTLLEDLGSKNGTTIDGTRVMKVVLRNGDCFSCGQVSCTYRESSVGMPTATLLN